ncbi:DUF2945 domain-containing protein [Streptomyces sp. LUP30]|uniref:DUF2945 domain-containing protein n=1 Tax=Streptomyces sp. LUP30 TaxID=1890285 RepID=UPI000851A957|nr:DUF2945 domain-containing protein [Streptomyces sp. LUP30]
MPQKPQPRKGDRVAWKSHGSETTGRVEKKITERTEAAGRTVDASAQDPQYEVRSDKSGRTAVHRPEALRRTREKAEKKKEGEGAGGEKS